MPVGAFTMLPLFLAVLIALAYPLGAWLARIANPEPVAGPVGALERAIYRIALHQDVRPAKKSSGSRIK